LDDVFSRPSSFLSAFAVFSEWPGCFVRVFPVVVVTFLTRMSVHSLPSTSRVHPSFHGRRRKSALSSAGNGTEIAGSREMRNFTLTAKVVPVIKVGVLSCRPKARAFIERNDALEAGAGKMLAWRHRSGMVKR
jgi:hypothetical protein